MTLIARIESDRTQARRDKDSTRAAFLSYLISEGRRIGKDADPPRDSTDVEVVVVIRKQIEHNEEILRLTKGEDRNAQWQNRIMTAYLPEQLSPSELQTLIADMIEASQDQPRSPKLIGGIMGKLKSEHSGQYDPKMAAEITKILLARPLDLLRLPMNESEPSVK